jgi:hypothetical protein
MTIWDYDNTQTHKFWISLSFLIIYNDINSQIDYTK